MDNIFPFPVVRYEPALWIESIALYSTPQKLLREIPFTRGLNIIWGVELDDSSQDLNPILISGHSVGKTTLCRLIRYCLGETTFGTSAAEERIRARFPQGFVVATIHIDGSVWHVRRDFSTSRRTYCTYDNDRKSLLCEKPKSAPKCDQFLDTLSAATVSPLIHTATPDDKLSFTWASILPWLTRDQEARFQSLWDWRSPRSESNSPKFSKPKEYPLYLIRLLLGLVHETEIALQEKILSLRESIVNQQDNYEQLQAAPQKEFDEARSKLLEALQLDSNTVSNAGDLFSIENHAEQELSRMRVESENLQQQIGRLNHKIDHYGATISRDEEEIKFILAVLTTKKPSAADEEKKRLAEWTEIQNEDCRYGRRAFRDCEHFVEYINELRAKAERKIIPLYGRPDHEIETELAKDDATLANLRSSITDNKRISQEHIDRRDEMQMVRAEIQYKHSALIGNLGNYRRTAKRLDGQEGNKELADILKAIEKSNTYLTATETELVSAQSNYDKNLTSLTLTYDWVTKRVLSDSYFGVVSMPGGDPKFDISERTGLSGEAVETLAIILADFASVLCSAQGLGFHPRFLIHDSPREADLDRHVYNHFLHVIWQISETLGGANAPFQYILTTTTKPPQQLFDNGIVKDKFRAQPESDMLFRCRLGGAALQVGLFDSNEPA